MFVCIFGNEERVKNFLESVLVVSNKILSEGTKIEEIEYIETEYLNSYQIICDIQVKTSNGIFIVKMKNCIFRIFRKDRIL